MINLIEDATLGEEVGLNLVPVAQSHRGVGGEPAVSGRRRSPLFSVVGVIPVRRSKEALASVLAAAMLIALLPASAAAREDTVTSFDGTKIAVSFFPAPDLKRGQRAPTILIGPGYLETEPFPHPQGQGVVCGQCLESLVRRALRAGEAEPKPPPPWDPRRHP